jgi:hypothetical protein
VLDRHKRRAAPLAPNREALQKAQDDEQDRGQDAYPLEGRQEAYKECRAAHHEERDH